MSFQHIKVCLPVIISFLKRFGASAKICKAKGSKFPCYLNGKLQVLGGTDFLNQKPKSLELGGFYDQNIRKKWGGATKSREKKIRHSL